MASRPADNPTDHASTPSTGEHRNPAAGEGSATADDHDDDVRYDVAIIGLGSAGEALASDLAADGWRVVGFEPNLVGGECPFVACMPSKVMLHDAAQGRAWQPSVRRRDEVTEHRDDASHAGELEKAGVVVVRSAARLHGDRCVEADGQRYRVRHVIIATGAAPVSLDLPGLDHPDVWNSEDALTTSEQPTALLIVGGGAIGAELSEVFVRFGTAVTLLEASSQLVADAEEDVSAALTGHLERLGVSVVLDARLRSVAHRSDSVVAELEDGRSFPASRVLVAAGVAPRWAGLGLETIGVDAEGVVVGTDGAVGGRDWLWAIGDVTPYSAWTHGANYQARRLADRLRGRTWSGPDTTVMPRAIFTHPPVGTVGLSCRAATDLGFDVVVGSATYDAVARAVTDELVEGVAAVVVDRASGRLLGGSIMGERADDVIQVLSALMVGGVPIVEASRMVFAFPTISQVLEVALQDAAAQLLGSTSRQSSDPGE